MSGGGSPKPPPAPAPTPTPVAGREEEEAKKKVRMRAKYGGRQSTILAGRMMSERDNNNILKTKLG